MTADSPVVRRAPWVSRLRIRGVTEAYSSNYVLLLAITLLLVVIGLVMVLSSSAIDSYSESDNFFSTFFKQGFFAIAGIPLMLMVSRMPVSLIRRWAGVFFLAALA
ncbi:MAG TPA: FtsW/RodA/SpoVE family cell cycle protein, partial [Pseudoclavibacter sp.]|nr:FtsW/RodA/SpoVE family cell cycle protein [Pseudoclavibacter sp.]